MKIDMKKAMGEASLDWAKDWFAQIDGFYMREFEKILLKILKQDGKTKEN